MIIYNDTTPTTQFPECQFSGEGIDAAQNEETADSDMPESCMQGLQEGRPPNDMYSLRLTTYSEVRDLSASPLADIPSSLSRLQYSRRA